MKNDSVRRGRYYPPKPQESKSLDDKIRELWGKYSVRTIAKMLDITTGAASGRAWRLGLRGGLGFKAPVPLSPDGAASESLSAPASAPVAVNPDPPPRRAYSPKYYSRCQYLIGNRPDWVHCLNPVARGSFCAEHATLCYRKEKDGQAQEAGDIGSGV